MVIIFCVLQICQLGCLATALLQHCHPAFSISFTPCLGLMAFRYRFNSPLTFGASRNKPIMLGKVMARIIASENLMTESRVAAAPTTTKTRNNILYDRSAHLERPNRNFHDWMP